MAKKRASLRGSLDKGSSEEKGKGIDLLFGGSAEDEPEESGEAGMVDLSFGTADVATEPTSRRSLAPETEEEDLSGLADDAFITSTLPVNTDVVAPAGMVDELGLPVAMEAPPADLELATPPEESLPVALETPPADLDTSLEDSMPVAMETPPADFGTSFEDTMPVAMESPPAGLGTEPALEDSMPVAMEAPPADLAPAVTDFPDTFGEADTGIPPAEEELIGLEDSGFAPEPEATVASATPVDLPPGATLPSFEPAEVPPSFASTPPFDSTSPPLTTPPVTPAEPPITPSIPSSAGVETPASPVGSNPYAPSSSMAMPRARIDSISGLVTEKIQVAEKDILPEDTKFSAGPVSNVLALANRAEVERDELVSQRVTRYIGRERRENLDKEIENLYLRVATELSAGKTDAEFALRTLSEAQDIILEDARQYDEALYRVAVVKTMIARKHNLQRWSYTWGSAVFFYAVVWLVALIAGFLFTDTIASMLNDATTSDTVRAVQAAWFSALAGGIGGVCGILYSLYWHVAVKQDFDRQYVMYYVVQPIMGFILGAIIYFILGAGFIFLSFATDPDSTVGDRTGTVLSSTTVIAIQVVLGWAAGFRMRFVLELVDKIVQKVSPRSGDQVDETNEPVSVVPTDQLDSIRPLPGRK